MPTQAFSDTQNEPEENRLSIARISLAAYRNYKDIRLTLAPSPIILTGANGSGKTNLLEAISLMVPGRGLRHVPLQDLQSHHFQQPWAVACELHTAQGSLSIGTGGVNDPMDGVRRLIQIDGKPARSQNILAEYVAMAWITPDMDRLLAEGASARRKFLDRLVYSFDPAHNARVSRYEKNMRERLRLLRDGPADAHWLSALEDDMAQTGVAIVAARRHLLSQLQQAIEETSGAFPRATLFLLGTMDEMLEKKPALLVEDYLRERYAKTRDEDAASGTCSTGPHRSDLGVIHQSKNCPAHLCSTGEQKALLIAVILAYIRTLSRHRDMNPIVLLDDIVAHLDEARRSALFEEILELGIQAWLSGTDSESFHSLLPYAQHFQVENGHIT